MRCNLSIEDATYGSKLFCKTCGMDINLNPIVLNNRRYIKLYCCKECAKNERA